jgi:hypothetical protein
MRLRSALPAALVAACALAPRPARAQTVLQTYNLSGCAEGPLRFDPAGTTVRGQIGCFGGTAQLERFAVGNPDVPFVYRWAGTLTAEFAPEFTGIRVQATPGSFVRFAYDDDRVGFTSFTPTGVPGFVVGSPAPAAFRSGGEPIPGLVDAATIRDVSTLFYFEYRLADDPLTVDPRLFFVPTTITFTATPEPSTFALAAVGGVALAAGMRRRRRATAE